MSERIRVNPEEITSILSVTDEYDKVSFTILKGELIIRIEKNDKYHQTTEFKLKPYAGKQSGREDA